MEDFEVLTGVPDESKNAACGLNMQELRNRLKHIAGLCYALSCEINNAELEADYLRQENEVLRRKLKEAGVKVKEPPKSVMSMQQRIKFMQHLKDAERKRREGGEDDG